MKLCYLDFEGSNAKKQRYNKLEAIEDDGLLKWLEEAKDGVNAGVTVPNGITAHNEIFGSIKSIEDEENGIIAVNLKEYRGVTQGAADENGGDETAIVKIIKYCTVSIHLFSVQTPANAEPQWEAVFSTALKNDMGCASCVYKDGQPGYCSGGHYHNSYDTVLDRNIGWQALSFDKSV